MYFPRFTRALALWVGAFAVCHTGQSVAADAWQTLCNPGGIFIEPYNPNPLCQVPPPDPGMVEGLVAQALAIAEACRNGAPGCPVPTPPPVDPDAVLDPVREQVMAAVAIAEACIDGSSACPASPPPLDPSPIITLVNQVYRVAEACRNGAPECPVAQPPPPNPDPVLTAVAQAVAIARACAERAAGCPAPVPQPLKYTGGGLGGYQICITTGLSLDGRLAGPAVAAQLTANSLYGSGSGQCSKDGKTWVDVTFSFVGTEDTTLSCATDPGSASYVLTGPFTINDGIANPRTDATLTIKAAYVDVFTRTVTADFDLPAVEMQSALQVFDVYPALRSSDPAVCMGSADCPIDTPPTQTPNVAPALGSLRADAAPPIGTTAFWVQFGVDPSVDTGLLSSTGCYQPTINRLQMAGTFDIVEPILVLTEEALELAGDEFADLVEDFVPDTVPLEAVPLEALEALAPLPIELTPNLGGVPVVEEVAAALPEFIEAISESLGGSLIPTLPDMNGTNGLPYLITVKYMTAAGPATLQTVSVSGLRTPVQVPNANNNGIPEWVYVLVTVMPIAETAQTKVILTVERDASGSIVLPADVSITSPPVDAAESQAGFSLQLGFEGLSVGGGAPKRFAVDILTSSRNDDIIANVNIIPGTASAALDVVGQYREAAQQTDLALRMHMTTPVRTMTIVSAKTDTKRVLSYDADITVPSISLGGLKNGREFDVRLTNVAPTVDFCADAGNGCVLPWRVHKCGKKKCPIPAATSASFSSRSRSGRYQETTINLKAHSPKVDDSGTVVSDAVTTVTNFKASQFGFDAWTKSYPQRYYLDTRGADADVDVLQVATYDQNGKRTKSFKVGGWFRAENRKITIKKHRVKVFGKTLFKYYTAHEKGEMACNENFRFNSGGKYPGWLDDAISFLVCWCFWGTCAIWPHL